MFAQTHRQMEASAGLALVLLTACTAPPPDTADFWAEAPVPTAPENPLPQPTHQRTLKLRLTLDSASDLKVTVGDRVIAGQVIRDRASERQPLHQEQQQLQRRLAALTPTLAVETARVQEAERLVQQAQQDLERFQATSPWTAYAQATLPLATEEQRWATLQANYLTAQQTLSLAQATLQAVQQQRAPTQADIEARLAAIAAQLTEAGIVRSPHTGEVQSIRWLEQTDQDLQVEITLTLAPDESAAPSGIQSGQQYGQQSAR